jgi:hypothetical protein
MGQTSLFPPIVNTAKIGQDVVDKEVRWRVGGMYKPMQGVLIEPGRTNKCTCVKANPTDTTNITKSGDEAATLTVVDDMAALVAAGLHKICTSGKVYKLDNSAGTDYSIWYFNGTTANTNKHSFGGYIRVTQGAARWRMQDTVNTADKTDPAYKRLVIENVTPAGTDKRLGVYADAGAIAYFILPQLEEGFFITSPIWRASDYTEPNTSLTRAAVCCSAPTADYMRSNNVAFMGEVNLNGLIQTDYGGLVGTTVDADNFFRINFRTIYNAVYIEKRIGGVSYSAPGCFYGTGLNTTIFQYQGFLCSTNGVGLRIRWYIDGAWSVWTDWQINTNTQDVPLGSTFDIGHQAGGYQMSACHRWHRTWFHNNSKAFLEGLTI